MKPLILIAMAILSGCATPITISPSEVRTFDDSATRLRCYELIDRKGEPHFVCVKTDLASE